MARQLSLNESFYEIIIFFALDGITKLSGVTDADISVSFIKDDELVAVPPSFTFNEIGSTGDYAFVVSSGFADSGYYVIQIENNNTSDIYRIELEVGVGGVLVQAETTSVTLAVGGYKVVGSDIQSDLSIVVQNGLSLIPTDSVIAPTAVVKDASSNVVATYTTTSTPAITKISTGNYRLVWTPTVSGDLTIDWSFQVDGIDYIEIDQLTVLLSTNTIVAGDQVIIDYIKRKLGHDVVGVELTVDQLTDAIDAAKRWYQSRLGQEKYYILENINGGGAYDMPLDCMYVSEVAFDLEHSDLYDQFEWAGVELGPMSFGMYGSYSTNYQGGGGYSYLIQAMNYREQSKKILSMDRDWYWDQAQRKLIITPASTDTKLGTKAAIRYLTTTIDLTRVDEMQFDMIRRYALAEALETLGYIRTKYADVPSAGGSISLNGDTLLSNAETEKMNLEEKIKTLRPPLPPMTF